MPLLPWTEKPIKVAVIGDIMLDEYLWGDVNRISPEAPVPVHLVKDTTYSPGGAANVALNIQRCGVAVDLWGRVGSDESGVRLKSCLTEHSIGADNIFVSTTQPTTKKTRIITGSQQIARIDIENQAALVPEAEAQILEAFDPRSFQVVVLSDYDKGFLSSQLTQGLIAKCKSADVPVIVDPKAQDFSKYHGAFLVTPNASEARKALGPKAEFIDDAKDLAAHLVKECAVENVLVTLGAQGMVWAGKSSDESHYLPALAREVYDVSGAGDTVLAVMTLALAAQASFPQAMSLANHAAHIVVQKKGTQPITQHELEDAVRGELSSASSLHNKIVSKEKLKDSLNSTNKKVVFTNGCFDLMHAGHVSYLEEAKRRGDLLVVGLNSDASIQRIKGKERPIVSCADRAKVLAALGCVDYVVVFEQDTPAELINFLVPQVLVKGADWQKEDIVGADVVTAAGGVVDTIELVPGLSTSEIIRRIQSTVH